MGSPKNRIARMLDGFGLAGGSQLDRLLRQNRKPPNDGDAGMPCELPTAPTLRGGGAAAVVA